MREQHKNSVSRGGRTDNVSKGLETCRLSRLQNASAGKEALEADEASEQPKRRMPRLQEDLFYVQPTKSTATSDAFHRRSATTARQPNGSAIQRDVRFSSPLESGQQRHKAEKTNRSSMKKRTAVSSAHSGTGSLNDHEEDATKRQGLTVIVDPVRPVKCPFHLQNLGLTFVSSRISLQRRRSPPRSLSSSPTMPPTRRLIPHVQGNQSH